MSVIQPVDDVLILSEDRDSQIMPEQPLYQYIAATPLGIVGLEFWLEGGDQQIDTKRFSALAIARVLGGAEALIQHLEDWLGVALDLEPSSIPDGHRMDVMLKPNSNSGEGVVDHVRLSLPASSLLSMRHPTEDLKKNLGMQWGCLSCELVIASFHLPREQLEAVEPGGMVLIPNSFENHWHCIVRVEREEQLFFDAELDPKMSLLNFNTPQLEVKSDAGDILSNSKNNQQDQVKIVLHKSMGIRVDRLIGWVDHPVVKLGSMLPSLTIDLKINSSLIATGSLLPVASGYGVLISETA